MDLKLLTTDLNYVISICNDDEVCQKLEEIINELDLATNDSKPACEHIYGLRINKDRKLVDVNVKPIDNDIFIWMRQFKYCPKCGLRL